MGLAFIYHYQRRYAHDAVFLCELRLLINIHLEHFGSLGFCGGFLQYGGQCLAGAAPAGVKVQQYWDVAFKYFLLECFVGNMLYYFFIPLPIDIKIALCVLLMAPCAGAAPALTESSGADGSIAAVINSISIPLSMGLMTLLLTIL